MDFDLFELEDDELFSSVCVVQTEPTKSSINNPLPDFNCTGEDSTYSQFSFDSFVKNFYIAQHCNDLEESEIPEIELSPSFHYKFDLNSLSSDAVLNFTFGRTRMHIQSIVIAHQNNQSIPIEDHQQTFYYRRRQVTLLLHLLNFNRDAFPWSRIKNHLQALRNLIKCVSSHNILKSIFMANNINGNEINSPAYHLLHGLLEWKFLDLIIALNYKEENSNSEETVGQGEESRNQENFEKRYEELLENLIILSTSSFRKKRLSDLLSSSPFPCICIKESWLLMQFLIEKTYDGNFFWKHFNNIINKMKIDPEKYNLTTKNYIEFTLWLLKSVSSLQGFKSNGIFEGSTHPRVIENFDLLENLVENFFSGNPPEEQIRIFLCLLIPIVLEWWKPPKVDIAMILWEHFNKKLNSAFFVSGSSPNNLAVTSASGKAYAEKMKAILNNPLPDMNLSSFSLFTIILGKTIENLNKCKCKHQTQKLLGRIFSKFSPAKFLTLNEVGIHHLIELFLILLLTAEDIQDTGIKLRDKLLSIPLEKIIPNRQITLMKGHISLMIIFVENNLEIGEYCTKLLSQLKTIKNDLNVSKILIEGLWDILKMGSGFDLKEHLLIDDWLPNYLNSCAPVEEERSLEAIHAIFNNNIKGNISGFNDGTDQLLRSLTTHVLPYIKQHFSISFSNWISSVAADFCLYCTGNDRNQFQKLFQFFMDCNCSNKHTTLKFLLAILSSDKSDWIDSLIIMQTWLKGLVLFTGHNEDVTDLTRIVCNLDSFRTICDLKEEELLATKQPLCTFISSVGKYYDSCKDFQSKSLIGEKFNSYLNGFEKWYSDKKNDERTEVSFRFYSFIAIVIFNCASFIYTKSKISCFFHIAMTRFILPCNVQMGKEPELRFVEIINKIWPVLIQGIGKLNFKSDPYLKKTLEDIICKWTPHFKMLKNPKIVVKPFVNCATSENDQLSLFVYEKLSQVFLTMQKQRQTDPNACLVITIFQEIVNAVEDDPPKMLIFLKGTFLLILEHLLMVDEKVVPSKRMLFELFQKIVKTPAYNRSPEIRTLMVEHLKTITVKHLSYFTFFYFELLTQIASNISPELVEDIMEFLIEQIKIVEGKRGGGQDNRIRTCLHKLKRTLLANGSKN